jgi:DNA-binding IclR family transcriptional regulator
MPLIPGLGTRIGANAHALGLGKIALSLLDERALERYIDHGLQAFTPATIVSADRLRAELAEIRAGGIASDREEFAEDHCCLAVPVHNASRCRTCSARLRRRPPRSSARPPFQRSRKSPRFLSHPSVRP